MIGVNLILATTQTQSNELNDLTIFKSVELYAGNLSIMTDLMHVPGSEAAIKQASSQTGMKCEYDVLQDQIRIEAVKARMLLREKFPMRYKLHLLKIFLSKDFSLFRLK